MKFSSYNHLFSLDSRFFLYNILSTAIVELEPDIAFAVRHSRIDMVNVQLLEKFRELGMVVSADADEELAYKYFYDRTRYGVSNPILHFTFIPTYACNLACPYCLQGGLKDAKKIDERGVASILSFIRQASFKQTGKVCPEKIFVTLYGGEPMLAKKELRLFCEGVVSIASSAELPLEIDMTTNLTLLDEDMIALIREYKIHVQASIDGSKHLHDKRRIFSNGKGTYDIIVANLNRLVEAGLRDQITVRLNVDSESINAVGTTFEKIEPYSNDIYFAFLTPYKGVNDGYENKCVTPDCYSTVATQKFNKVLSTHGREIAQPFGKKSPCALNSENKFWIDCNLDVYKCELLVKMPECRIGYLTDAGELIIEPNLYKQMNFSPCNYDKCYHCKLLPMCGGGCPATAYLDTGVRNGDVSRCQCVIDEKSLTDYLIDYVKRLEMQ